MNTKKFKEILEENKARLEIELATVGRRNPSNPGDWEALPPSVGQESDPFDTATQIEGYEENTAILKDLEDRYGAVHSALTRIESGTYGVCSVDGSVIPLARLEANPAATTCVEHAS